MMVSVHIHYIYVCICICMCIYIEGVLSGMPTKIDLLHSKVSIPIIVLDNPPPTN